MLSIATAPVDARQRTSAIVVTAALTALCAAVLPFASHPLPVATAALPLLLGIALTANLITGSVLLGQFISNRLLGTAFLACAYLAAGFGLCGYLAAFPGLFGTAVSPQASIWVWGAWHIEFPLLVIAGLLLDRGRRQVRDRAAARRWVAALVPLAAFVALLPSLIAFAGSPSLPPLLDGTRYAGSGPTVAGEFVAAINVLALVLCIVWTRGRTVLHTWLIVALASSVLDVELSLAATARFTAGWYFARLLVVSSSAAVLIAYLQQVHALFTKLSDLSMVDGLTTLPNRRFFEMRLESAVRIARRAQQPLAVLLADVDGFKEYNDTYGHLAGDEALKAIAAELRVCALRPGDVVSRWGGEEFAAVLPETDVEGARMVAERMRASVEAIGITHRRAAVPGGAVTISVGATLLGIIDDDPALVMERVDAALYAAKSRGRNAVAVELPKSGPALPRRIPGFLDASLQVEG